MRELPCDYKYHLPQIGDLIYFWPDDGNGPNLVLNVKKSFYQTPPSPAPWLIVYFNLKNNSTLSCYSKTMFPHYLICSAEEENP